MREPKPRAVVLLSGGLDSATTAYQASDDGYEVHTLTVQYGQRAQAELDAARRIASALPATDHKQVTVDLGALGGSALTTNTAVPRDRSDAEMAEGIPPTYVPARNTVLLAVALAAAEVAQAEVIYLGVNAVDYSGYPDCRPAYLRAFEAMGALGTQCGVQGAPIAIRAPLLSLSKADIVRRGQTLGVPFELTLSCYDPVPDDDAWRHCGRCDACRLRARGFADAAVLDPALQR